MLNSKDVLNFRALIDSNISHDKYVLMSNALKEYNNMKEENQKFKNYNSSSNILVDLWDNVNVVEKWNHFVQSIEKIRNVKT